MVSRLPRWVEYGAFTLALLAGLINAVGMLGVQHQAISHLTGIATLLGSELLVSPLRALDLFGILISFVLGAAVSGYFLPSYSLKLGRHYDSLLLIEGSLLVMAAYALSEGSLAGHYLASAACGMQNAFATRYSGAVVRTTHLTGIFTDLGIMLGGLLKGESVNGRRVLLFLLIVVGFLLGGVLGAVLYAWIGFVALIIPAIVCYILAIVYWAYRRRTQAAMRRLRQSRRQQRQSRAPH